MTKRKEHPVDPNNPEDWDKLSSHRRKKRERQRLLIDQPTIGLETQMERERLMEVDQPATSTTVGNTMHVPSPARHTPPNPTQTHLEADNEPPRFTKDQKGKGKDEGKSSEESTEESSDDDEEIDITFEGLDMDRETTYGTKSAHNLVTEFAKAPQIDFIDHMAPFRGLMSDLKKESQEVRNGEVTKLFKPYTRKKILAATSGMNQMTDHVKES